jgi:formylglycine-generating enzyme required for sulfatase activity
MAQAPIEKLKVFISYSRRDSSEFAEELVGMLEIAGFAPFLDRHDIAAGEDWEQRLGGLIREADTVLFVVSPEAVKSERCAWEAESALAQFKRVLPIIFKAVPESAIPERLRRLQFVRFDTGTGLARPLAQLAEALRQDIEWVREHTRLGELARRWEARGRPESLLLRGDELAAAESWAGRWKPGVPEITDLMRSLLSASKQSEAAYLSKANTVQRRVIWMQSLVSVLLVGVIAGLIGWINQSYIKQQWHWYATVRPFAAANIWPYVLTLAAEQALKQKDTFRECANVQGRDNCPEMVVVPAGSFVMGSLATEPGRFAIEDPQHEVTIARPFAVAKFEVTFDEWDTCVTYGDCGRVGDRGWGRGQRPVIFVSRDDALHYVAWLSQMTGQPYRLLSEAEYEYAARAGTHTIYPWGDEVQLNGAAMANCDKCGSTWDDKQTAPVGSFAPNQFGLYDMVGNVWEWIQDCAHPNYNGAPTDGTAWQGADCNGLVIRGGSWNFSPESVRSAMRGWSTEGGRDNYLGFRVARTLAP